MKRGLSFEDLSVGMMLICRVSKTQMFETGEQKKRGTIYMYVYLNKVQKKTVEDRKSSL